MSTLLSDASRHLWLSSIRAPSCWMEGPLAALHPEHIVCTQMIYHLCWLVSSIPLILPVNLVGSPGGYFCFNLNTFFNLLVLSDSCYHSACFVRLFYEISYSPLFPNIYAVQKRYHKKRLNTAFQRSLHPFPLQKDNKEAVTEEGRLTLFSEISGQRRIQCLSPHLLRG